MTSGERRLQQVLEQLSDEGNSAPQMAKNIIIFIGDGMGMASITAGRIFKGQQRGGRGEEENLEFDAFPHIGLAKVSVLRCALDEMKWKLRVPEQRMETGRHVHVFTSI